MSSRSESAADEKRSAKNRWSDVYRSDARVRAFLSVLLFSSLAYGFYRGIQDNYLAEIVHISEFERGVVEFFRELPGLLLIFILAAMYRFSESKIFRIGTAIMLAGSLGLLFGSSGKVSVIAFMVLYSAGEHIVMPVKSTISLEAAKPGKGGVSLGITSGIGHIGNIVGFLVVSLLFMLFSHFGIERGVSSFRIIFAIATALMIASVLISFAMKDSSISVARRSRFYFNRKFNKYYMLEVFYGARKQIFLTFAPYVLILQYGADTAVISLLLAICAAFGIVFSPLIGKLIDRLGYKIIMVTDTLILMVVCFFYGFAHRLFPPHIAYIVVCANYVLDSIISLASMASNVYVQDISSTQEEMTATITTGISVNHLISILIALFGGWIWQKTGIEVLFTLSGVLGLCNTLFACTIKNPKEALQP
ncbi:MAG: MFS transporter [Sphaerochaetaceae bacterium]|nr:MFS transporter [Sphaerochaetaceae bacterium]